MYRKKDHGLELAASIGLSNEYLNKGPLSSLQSIAASLKDGPVCIYDVRDDPRIQYPKEARTEGLFSILSVPMIVKSMIEKTVVYMIMTPLLVPLLQYCESHA